MLTACFASLLVHHWQECFNNISVPRAHVCCIQYFFVGNAYIMAHLKMHTSNEKTTGDVLVQLKLIKS